MSNGPKRWIAGWAGHLAWLPVLLVSCRATPGPAEPPPRAANVSGSQAGPPARPLSSAVPEPASPEAAPPAAPEPSELAVELVLGGVDGAWPVGEVVLAQTLVSDDAGAMRRELFVVDDAGAAPLRQLTRRLSLDQFVRVAGARGAWPHQVWLEVHGDLVSEKRLELFQLDAERQVPSLTARFVGSMQTRLDAAELTDGWLFVLHDPLANGAAGRPRLAGLPPLPSPPPFPKGGAECAVPYQVCGLRSAETRGFELLAIRCEHTPVTVSWKDRTAKPSERVWPVASAPLSCGAHPDLRLASPQPGLRLEAGQLPSAKGAPVRISTPDGPLKAGIDDAFSLAGKTWLVAGGALYRQRATGAGALKVYDIRLGAELRAEVSVNPLTGDDKVRIFGAAGERLLAVPSSYLKNAIDETAVLVQAGRLELPYASQGIVEYDDVDFDGQPDLAIRDGDGSCYGAPSYRVFLREGATFRASEPFTRLAHDFCGMFSIDPARRRLRTFDKDGCCLHSMQEYSVAARVPRLVSEVMFDTTDTYARTIHQAPGRPRRVEHSLQASRLQNVLLTFTLAGKPMERVVLFASGRELDCALVQGDEGKVQLSYRLDKPAPTTQAPSHFTLGANGTELGYRANGYTLVIHDRPDRFGVTIVRGGKATFTAGVPETREGGLDEVLPSDLDNLSLARP